MDKAPDIFYRVDAYGCTKSA